MNAAAETHMSHSRLLAAGVAAGMAEVVWIALYSSLTPLDAYDVARAITATFRPGEVTGAGAAAAGLGIHFVLSLALAAAFVSVCYRPLLRTVGRAGVVAGALAVLAAVWAMNFFVVLPAINPAFVELMPLPVTLVSKLLFGLLLAMALVRSPR